MMKLEDKKKVLEGILTTINDKTIISEMMGLLEVEPFIL